MKFLLAIMVFSYALVAGAQHTYYMDALSGNDSNQGTSPEAAWKSLDKVNRTLLYPGDSVCFRRGGTWFGNFIPTGSGTEEQKIVFCAYGAGPAPVLNARGRVAPGEKSSYTMRFFNQEYVEVRDLKIMNFKPFEEPEKIQFREGYVFANSEKMGIYLQGEDYGDLHGISLIDLEVCAVNGSMNTKHNGGIFLEITRNEDPGKQVPSRFVGLLVTGCWIHDVDRTGISNMSAWWNRSEDSQWGETLANGKTHDWFPSQGIIIRNNRFERTGANALIIRAAEAPLIEHNLFTQCSVKGSGNASFPFNCDNALFQYNEACHTYFNTEADSWNGRRDADAGGFDSDWNCKNTVIQFNYSHHNGFGGILVCCDGGSKVGFNTGTIIRYNIFENNRHHIVRTSGPARNTLIHNNLFYSGMESDTVMLVFHKSWGGFSDSVTYQNNIFFSTVSGTRIETGNSTRNRFENNLYQGPVENLPYDPGAVLGDPLFTGNPDSGTGWKSWLGFLLRTGSPAIDAGLWIEGMPGKDFRGTPVNGSPEIGPLEFTLKPVQRIH